MSCRDAYDDVEVGETMRRLVDDIVSGKFADEWDAERDAGFPNLIRLREQFAGPQVAAFEAGAADPAGRGRRPRVSPGVRN